MNPTNEWNDALDTWVEEERDRLGGPPSPEEIVAYLSGELSVAAAARVRALLVYYPELTSLLDERIEPARRPQKPLALRVYVVAATLVIAILWTHRPQQEPSLPSEHFEFNSLRARGPTRTLVELPVGKREYLITIVPGEPPADGDHEIEITRASAVLWSARRVRPVHDTFVLIIPGDFLSPGQYTLTLSTNGRPTDRYAFRVTE